MLDEHWRAALFSKLMDIQDKLHEQDSMVVLC